MSPISLFTDSVLPKTRRETPRREGLVEDVLTAFQGGRRIRIFPGAALLRRLPLAITFRAVGAPEATHRRQNERSRSCRPRAAASHPTMRGALPCC